MTVVRLPHTDGTVVYTGAGWSTISDSSAFGGNYHSTLTNGNSVSISVGAASGYTGFLIGYTSVNFGNFTTVTVDGVVQGTYPTANNSTSGNVGANIYQRLLPPCAFVGNGAHTIVLTAVGGMNINFIEFYTAEAVVPGRLTTFGHSITAGYGLAAPASTRFSKLVANAFNLSDDNFGVSSEDLTNGNNSCNGVIADTYTAMTIVFTSATSGSCSLVYTPVAAGASPITIPGVAWNMTTVALQGAINTALAPLGANAVTCSVGPLPLSAVVIQFSGTAPAFRGPQNLLTIAAGNTINYTGTPIALYGVQGTANWNWLIPVPGWNRAWNGTSAIGDNWFGRRPELALVMHGLNDCGYTNLLDASFGAGYGAERFKARIRELNWRMNLNCPNTQIIHCGVCYDNVPLDNSFDVLRRSYSTYLAAACADPTCKNVTYVDTWIPTVNNGRNALMFAPPGVAQGHPNELGHEVIAREVIAAARVLRGHASVRLGL